MAEKQTRTRTTTAARSGSRARQAPSRGPAPAAGPSVPVLVPGVHVRHVPVPRLGVGHVAVPKVSVPIPEQLRHVPNPADNKLLWYGGLAGLAAVGVIGWPVAGVVAAGSYVAEHRARSAIAGTGDGERSTTGATSRSRRR